MSDPAPGRHLLVASTGGHLTQLVKWAPRLGADDDSLWVTFQSPQSDSLLKGRRKLYVPYVSPRDIRRTVGAFSVLMREIDWKAEKFTAAVSTGAALALAGLSAARLHRIPSFYIESVSRVNSPSLTGRLIGLDPWIHKSCQYEHWSRGSWEYRGSLFDMYETTGKASNPRPRLFVTLGTIRPYRFDALIDAVLRTGLADNRTVWQLGETSRSDLPGTVVSQLTHDEFEQCAQEADVVITHCGVGTILDLLDMGIYPVVVPRRASRGEHVDDHQLQAAKILSTRKVAYVAEAYELEDHGIIGACATAIVRSGN